MQGKKERLWHLGGGMAPLGPPKSAYDSE